MLKPKRKRRMSDVNADPAGQIERMKKDRFLCELIGVELVEVGVGHARARLALRPDHLNGVGIVQGGVLYSIADYAFAAAANYADPVVGIETTISFVKSVKSGVITAEATEIARSRRFSRCRVEVTDDAGRLLAVFSGCGYLLPQ